jgi:hypothetical protein
MEREALVDQEGEGIKWICEYCVGGKLLVVNVTCDVCMRTRLDLVDTSEGDKGG